MKFKLPFLVFLFFSASINSINAQHLIGKSREQIMEIPWVKEYYNENPFFKGFATLNPESREYKYSLSFSADGICVTEALWARSFKADSKLRDFISTYGTALSESTYVINPPQGKKFVVNILATHNRLPHQVTFSYKQIFKTEGIPREDTYPYEFKD